MLSVGVDLVPRAAAAANGGAIEDQLRKSRAALNARETQDAFRTAGAKLAQERTELAKTLADASARPPEDAA